MSCLSSEFGSVMIMDGVSSSIIIVVVSRGNYGRYIVVGFNGVVRVGE